MSVGLGWFILAEALIGAFWDGSSRWGPAAVSHALAVGGAGGVGSMGGATPGISYATATLLTIGYSLAALTITATLLTRRHQLNCTCQSARDARTTCRDRRAVRGASRQRGFATTTFPRHRRGSQRCAAGAGLAGAGYGVS
jgi:hypothetical protein